MPPPNQRRPTSAETRAAEQRFAAEERYARYQRELRDLLFAAERDAHEGQWDAASQSLNSALMTIGAMTGVCRELRLIYLLIEE